jgi:hypothetical protein
MSDSTMAFPHKILTPLNPNKKPTPLTLDLLHQELNDNAMPMTPSTFGGGGTNGHLALIMTEAEYLLIDNMEAWINPKHLKTQENWSPSLKPTALMLLTLKSSSTSPPQKTNSNNNSLKLFHPSTSMNSNTTVLDLHESPPFMNF